LDIFRQLVKKEDRAILFSTHITSDLDKCASDITYIHDGEIIYSGTKKDFVNSYLFVKDKTLNKELLDEYIAYKEFDDRIEGLISADKKEAFIRNKIEPQDPDLEQIMVYLERSKDGNESFDL
jgi:ABC-2 type transport system ATP-binding protein